MATEQRGIPVPKTQNTPLSSKNIHTETGSPTISGKEIRDCLARLRHIHWTVMVYKVGLVPVHPRPTETMWARSDEIVRLCFEPSQPQRITERLNTHFNPSQNYSFHKSFYHKSCGFCLFVDAYLYSVGTQHGNLHPAW